MHIRFYEKEKIFEINTPTISYIIEISKHGYLLHRYFGKAISDHTVLGAQTDIVHASFSPNPPNTEDKNFSLDTQCQEYSCVQTGDFRISSIELENSFGELSSELLYESHEIFDVKPERKNVPSILQKDKKAQTLAITCNDVHNSAKVVLYYSVIEEIDTIIRWTSVKNYGNVPLHIQKLASCCIDFMDKDFDFVQLYGSWSKECNVERANVPQGIHTISSRRGSTSHHHNPFVALVDKETSETAGDVFGFSLLYSNNFAIELERDFFDNIRLVAGINQLGFDYELNPNEVFTTPEIALTYSATGIGAMSRTYHSLYRNHLCKSEWTHKKRPLLINTWEAAYFDFTETTILEFARESKNLGIEMLVMDDGWFGKRNDDSSSLGDWYVNEDKLRGGLPKLVQEVNDIGLEFGIWYEPEMVSPKSDLYTKHPEWCLHMKNRDNCPARHQFVLNLGLQEVQDYLYTVMTDVLSSCNIAYVKWDFNRNLTNVYDESLGKKRQGEVFHRYLMGLYALLERLTDTFPHILWEGCSGGGGRFDPAVLRYFPQIWTSDNTDAVDRLEIQYGTSMVYPVSTMGSHVSTCPNHISGRTTPLNMRSIVAMSGTYGFELNPLQLSDDEKSFVKDEIQKYHQYYDLIQNGEYFRLTGVKGNHYAWQFVSNDKNESLVSFVVSKGGKRSIVVKLQGLNPSYKYKDSITGNLYFGDTLMNFGYNFSAYWKQYSAVQIYFTKVE